MISDRANALCDTYNGLALNDKNNANKAGFVDGLKFAREQGDEHFFLVYWGDEEYFFSADNVTSVHYNYGVKKNREQYESEILDHLEGFFRFGVYTKTKKVLFRPVGLICVKSASGKETCVTQATYQNT